MMTDLVYVVLPTYNEAENITPMAEQILAQPGVHHLVVVDDNSPDGTGQVADELGLRFPGRVAVIHRAGKLGLGTAYTAGFRHALAEGAARVVTMDADFSHKPTYIPAMLRKAQTFQLVIGSRYIPSGGTANWGLARRALSRTANAVAHIVLGLSARDCTAGFRCYHADLLRMIDLGRIRSNGYSFLIEMLFLCQELGATVGEVPIIFEDRRFGQSKISQAEIIKAWRTVGRLALRRLYRRFASRSHLMIYS